MTDRHLVADSPEPRAFEDFLLGQRQTTRTTVRSACSSAFLDISRWVPPEGAVQELRWSAAGEPDAGESLTVEVTVVGRRIEGDGRTGLVRRYALVRGERGNVLQEGMVTTRVAVRAPRGSHASLIATDFCSPAWGDVMAPLLAANADFDAATATFDGSIALTCGQELIQFRVYKSRILDVARSMPTAPTFTVTGTELSWVNLILAERNEYVSHASKGMFGISGSAFEYLRLLKAVVALWDSARELASTPRRS